MILEAVLGRNWMHKIIMSKKSSWSGLMHQLAFLKNVSRNARNGPGGVRATIAFFSFSRFKKKVNVHYKNLFASEELVALE